MKTVIAIAGVALAAYFAYDLHQKIHDWSAGNGETPRALVAEYLHMAYDEGRGASAARTYFATGALDNAPNATDRSDGPPIGHRIKAVVAEGANVAVYHQISAARGQPAVDAIDIYKTMRGHIVERDRVAQPATNG